MSGTDSLFAQMLKQHRLERGEHGRMTQEQLAEALGVSLDAVSKYERSLSFIRGDMEHRLGERLGWSRDSVRACREDWETRSRSAGGEYRVLDEALLARHFGGSMQAAADAAVEMSFAEMGDLPDALSAEFRVYSSVSSAFPDMSSMVILNGRIVAQWFVVPLLPEDEAAFRQRNFQESGLSVDRIHRPILPGTYFGYCPALVVARGHERAAGLLLGSFVSHLEDLAGRDILYRGIGTIGCTPGGRQLCLDLGMDDLGAFEPAPSMRVFELTGSGLARSIFARKSRLVRDAYARAFL